MYFCSLKYFRKCIFGIGGKASRPSPKLCTWSCCATPPDFIGECVREDQFCYCCWLRSIDPLVGEGSETFGDVNGGYGRIYDGGEQADFTCTHNSRLQVATPPICVRIALEHGLASECAFAGDNWGEIHKVLRSRAFWAADGVKGTHTAVPVPVFCVWNNEVT